MKTLWSGPSREEVRAVAIDLIVRHGPQASEEAFHLAKVAQQLGSAENTQLYSRAARCIENFLYASKREHAAAARRSVRH
ncbi:MAG: hypothetical protein ACLPGW_03530 [Roseiarcus sp.]